MDGQLKYWDQVFAVLCSYVGFAWHSHIGFPISEWKWFPLSLPTLVSKHLCSRRQNLDHFLTLVVWVKGLMTFLLKSRRVEQCPEDKFRGNL